MAVIPTYVADGGASGSVNSQVITLSASTTTLNGVTIVGTAGQFTCFGNSINIGSQVTVSGTSTGSIGGYSNPTTYVVTAASGGTSFTLGTGSSLVGTTPITTVNGGSLAGLTFSVINGPVAVGDLLLCMIAWNGSSTNRTPTITDNLNVGAWNLPASLHYFPGNTKEMVVGWIRCDTATTVSVAVTAAGLSATDFSTVHVLQYTGFTTGVPTLITADITTNSGNSTSPASVTFNNSVINELSMLVACSGSGGNFGTITGSFTNRGGVSGSGMFAEAVNTTAGNAVSFGATIASSQWATLIGSWSDLSSIPIASLGQGTSTGATTAATGQGTGGVAMPAIVVGNEVDVIVGIQNSSLPSTLVVGDGSNTYTQIDNFNDAGNGYIWYRFASLATVALTTPTLTATANAGYFPTSMSIAAAPLSGITGFTAGNVAHNQQLSPGGTDAQVSGFTPSLLGGPGISYTIAAFGFSASKATAPAAGTGFTQVATAWAALGTGACLTYEVKQLGSGGAPVQATFTPTTSRAYTLVAAFNNIQLPVSPAGPMPRQIYIMP